MSYAIRFLLVVTGVIGVASACTDPEAPTRCRELRDAYCAQQGALCEGTTETGCQGLFDELIACDEAVGVDDDYDECRTEIDALTECPTALPAECRGTIYLPEEDD